MISIYRDIDILTALINSVLSQSQQQASWAHHDQTYRKCFVSYRNQLSHCTWYVNIYTPRPHCTYVYSPHGHTATTRTESASQQNQRPQCSYGENKGWDRPEYRSLPLIRPPILYTTSSPKRGGGVVSSTQLVSIIRPLKTFRYVLHCQG